MARRKLTKTVCFACNSDVKARRNDDQIKTRDEFEQLNSQDKMDFFREGGALIDSR